MYFQITLSLFFIISTLHSCSSMKSSAINEQKKGHYRLYSHPEKVEHLDSEKLKRVVLIGSNDFRGQVSPLHFNIPSQKAKSKSISVGGISGMKAYAQIFKLSFPNETLFLDAGSFYHSEKNIKMINSAYNYLGYDIIGLGDEEFKLKSDEPNYLSTIGKSVSGLDSLTLTSNLFNLAQATKASIKNNEQSAIKNVNGVRIGVISILSQETPDQSPSNNFLGLYIQNNVRSIINKTKQLRKSGAEVIVMLTNLTIDCVSETANQKKRHIAKVNFDTKSSKTCQKKNSNLYKTLSKLPPGVVDIVFTSGGRTKVANTINGIPVLQNDGEAKFYSWAELYFDKANNELIREKTVIHQPVKLCHQFLKESEDCYLEEDLMNEKIAPAVFLGSEVIISPLPAI